MSDVETRHKKPSYLVSTLTIFSILGAAATMFAAWLAWSTYVSDLRESVRHATYELRMTDGMLIMSASDTARLPTSVEVSPVFGMPGDRLAESFGDFTLPYEGLQPREHLDGKAIIIRGIPTDTCMVVSNRERCEQFEIKEYRVKYSFGPFVDPLIGYVPASP